jgi:hypothetical protein
MALHVRADLVLIGHIEMVVVLARSWWCVVVASECVVEHDGASEAGCEELIA